MPRGPRVCFEGAIYHVINRGNYRGDIFASAATAQAFEACLYEAAERMGWRLHAYVIMRNHYHLALGTPRANLTEGMQWLQSTFAIRFNRFRRERGHLFQGRYQALLVEPGPTLAKVVNYIHLNPVRAQIVTIDQLRQFRWSSYRRFLRSGRPSTLACDAWLPEMGGLADTAAGWESYSNYLRWLATDDVEQKKLAAETFTRGWAIGSAEWRKAIVRERTMALPRKGGREPMEWKEAAWAKELDERLRRSRRTREDVARSPKKAKWKIALATELRSATTATNAWIARELHMGTPGSVSAYVSTHRRQRIEA